MIEGVWGIIGVVIGWGLSMLTMHIGRVRISISNPSIKFERDGDVEVPRYRVKYYQQPEYILMKFSMNIYNNYSRCNSITDHKFYIIAGEKTQVLNISLMYMDKLYNIEPYRYVDIHTQSYLGGKIDYDISIAMKLGYKLYFEYRINHGRSLYKIKIAEGIGGEDKYS